MIKNAQERYAIQGINFSNPMSQLAGVLLLAHSEEHYDCNAEIIKPGDEVEVATEDERRMNNPEYQFCSKGKRGKILHHIPGCNSWFVSVEFPTEEGNPKSVGCVDYNLRKVA